MVSDMEKYKIHEMSPGKQWMDELVEGLKVNILKVLSKKEARLQPNGFPFEGNGS